MGKIEKPKILAVDDKPANLLALEAIVEGRDFDLHTAASGQEALDLVLKHDYAMILLDVQMPDMNGFETAERIRGVERAKYIPIVFLTAGDDVPSLQVYEKGAVDFLIKPFHPKVLKSKISVFVELFRKTSELVLQKEREKNREIEELQETLEAQKYLTGWQESSMTADLAGVGPLRERVSEIFSSMQTEYESLLDQYIESIGYKKPPPSRDEIRKLADRIGDQGAGPRDVIDLHINAVAVKCQGAHPNRAIVYTKEGRVLALEVMGYLADYYRMKR